MYFLFDKTCFKRLKLIFHGISMATLNIIFTRETMIDGTRTQTRRYSKLYFWTRSREWPIHGPMSIFMKMSSFHIDFQSYILNHFSVKNFVSTLFCWPSKLVIHLATLVIQPMYRTWWFGFNLVAIDEILNDKALIVLVGCVPWISLSLFFSRSSRSEVEKC